MIQVAKGIRVRDETEVKANTATAPAPHLPVPLAALNPRQFVPPLSPHDNQSLPQGKERRRNATRLLSPWRCRHFRPQSWRGGAEEGEEVGCRSLRASRKRTAARHWCAGRRRASSDQANVLGELVF